MKNKNIPNQATNQKKSFQINKKTPIEFPIKPHLQVFTTNPNYKQSEILKNNSENEVKRTYFKRVNSNNILNSSIKDMTTKEEKAFKPSKRQKNHMEEYKNQRNFIKVNRKNEEKTLFYTDFRLNPNNEAKMKAHKDIYSNPFDSKRDNTKYGVESNMNNQLLNRSTSADNIMVKSIRDNYFNSKQFMKNCLYWQNEAAGSGSQDKVTNQVYILKGMKNTGRSASMIGEERGRRLNNSSHIYKILNNQTSTGLYKESKVEYDKIVNHSLKGYDMGKVGSIGKVEKDYKRLVKFSDNKRVFI